MKFMSIVLSSLVVFGAGFANASVDQCQATAEESFVELLEQRSSYVVELQVFRPITLARAISAIETEGYQSASEIPAAVKHVTEHQGQLFEAYTVEQGGSQVEIVLASPTDCSVVRTIITQQE